ncbi:hypothetical protein AVEN_201586-1 [Araneus ventricosus]|uniref:Uncharacterized protein n=1 Tax=Araneus ventricosus TaxID=182803 RepID=A0A4Y2FDK3_ARAVE|nr:hypothetical protein AVEN_201586-1 [Araneus ventricosus]
MLYRRCKDPGNWIQVQQLIDRNKKTKASRLEPPDNRARRKDKALSIVYREDVPFRNLDGVQERQKSNYSRMTFPRIILLRDPKSVRSRRMYREFQSVLFCTRRYTAEIRIWTITSK